MKNKVIGFFMTVLPVLGFTQNWQPFGDVINEAVYALFNDTISEQLYAGGDYYAIDNDSNMRGIAMWDGEQWHSLGTGLDSYQFPASLRAIIRYHDEIYVGGYLTNAHSGAVCNGIARWDGTIWKEVDGGVLSSDGSAGIVEGFSIINDELYVSGVFKTVDGITVNGLAKWNGTNWSDVHGFPFFNDPDGDFVNATVIYENELYVGGSFYDNNGRVGITKWDGTDWVSVANGTGTVFRLIVYKNKLYAAGAFSKGMNPAFPGYYIAAWNGSNWDDVGGGVLGENGVAIGDIYDVAIHNDELYAVGVFESAGGVPAQHIAKWDENEWCGLGNTMNGNILSVAFYKDTLYIGGGYSILDGMSIRGIAKWTGGDYVDTCGAIIGVEENNIETFELEIYPNPATNLLTIKTTAVAKAEYFIYDINGRKLGQWSMVNGQSVIDVSALAEGLYLLQLQTEQGSINRKFVKRK